LGGGERVECVDDEKISLDLESGKAHLKVQNYFGIVIRTLVGHWLGVARHFALPYLWALVPGGDERVHVFRTL
jgi:hypothetical protein